ncbi:MAG TPA: ABC transporter substrate-binding protein [Opitutaceae bacterium]|jgi:ABC-type nitrate/sulfonate/bicarbonate transport system substrate-binding protein|nr:ABC transporter substrate-binding protein [Opitutaceae bacterium]
MAPARAATITEPLTRRAFLRRAARCGAAWGAAQLLRPARLRAEGPPPLGRIAYQLSWIKNFQYAGCYLAQERGYYARNGLGVDLVAGGPTINADPIVASGRALVGQSSPDFIANAVSKGARLRGIGADYQQTVFCIISMARQALRVPGDLIGRRIGIQTNNLVIWHAFLRLNGIDPGRIVTVPVQYDLTPLVAGEVDGFFGYLNDDAVHLRTSGHEIHCLKFSDFGYRMFTATYSVPEAALRDPRQRAQLVAFVRGEALGWRDAIEHPRLAARLTTDVYGRDNGLDFAVELASCLATNPLMESAATRRHGLFWMSPQGVADTITTLAAARVRAAPELFTNEILEEAYQGESLPRPSPA